MISRKFFTSSLLYTISAALPTAAAFLLLPFYTNTDLLSVPDFGALALYIGLTLAVQIVVGLNLDFYVGVAYHKVKDQPEQLKRKIATLNGYLLLVSIVVLVLFFAVGNFFISNFIPGASPETLRYVLMSVFTGVFNAHFKFYNSLLINEERPWRYFWSNILNFFTTAGFSLMILHAFPLTLEGPMWGRLLSGLSIFLLSFSEVAIRYGVAFHREYLKPSWKFCYPLIITALFAWVLAYSDRYIIKLFLFNTEVAVFDLAVRFTLLAEFLLSGLNSAMTPKIFTLLKNPGDVRAMDDIKKYYSGFNLISLLFIPLSILLVPLFLPFLLSAEKYLESFLFFGIVSAGLLTRSIHNLFIYPIHFFSKTEKLILINGISAILQIALGYFMIHRFGLFGAAYALTIVKLVQLFLYYVFARNLVTVPFNFQKIIFLPLLSLTLISVAEMFVSGYGATMHLIHLGEFIVITTITLFIYWKETKMLFAWAKKIRFVS